MRHGIAGASIAAAVVAIALAACGEPESVERATVLPAVVALEDGADAALSGADGARPGNPAVAPGELDSPAVTLCVDTVRSLIRWRGTKVGGSHEGVVRVAGGRVRFRDGRVGSGQVTVDMGTIAVTDIPPDQPVPRQRLRDHLAHEEFFGVDRFPTARFVLTGVEAIGVEATGPGLYSVSGNLAIRDSVHNITFDATAPVVTSDELWAAAHFGIDRQLWGIDFDGRTSALRNALVHDLIQLEVHLVADRDACG